MSGNPFKKLAKGDELSISATAFNALMDVAQREYGGAGSAGAGGAQVAGDHVVCRVLNNSGAAVDRFAVLGVDDAAITYADNPNAFKSVPIISGVTPTVPDFVGYFIITLEPIRDGKIGRCLLAGLVPVQIAVANAGDEWADVKDDDATQLQSGSAGAAQILWKESGTGTKWAWVRLGPPAKLYEAKITAKTAINGGIRWKYTIELGRFDMTSSPSTGGRWVADTGAGTCYAFNSAEDMNTFTSGTGAIGTGNTNVTQSDGTVDGSACKLVPLPVGGYVVVKPRGIDTGATPSQRYFTIINFTSSAQ
jgi:hypothetical protein